MDFILVWPQRVNMKLIWIMFVRNMVAFKYNPFSSKDKKKSWYKLWYRK